MDETLAPERIRLKAEAADWQQAVTLAGELLQRDGCVEARYIQATIEAVRTMGPYIVLAPGIAIPHARPGDGALKTGISLVTLAHPVCFGSEENDPVDLVIGLASIDKSSHIGLIKRICNFLSDDENVAKLRAIDDPVAASALINSN